MELAPENGFFTWAAAGYHQRKGDTEGAIALYEKALALGDEEGIPVTQYARTSLWRLYLDEQKQPDKARDVLLEGARLNPERGPLWCELGKCYRETGDLDEAVKAYRRACEVTPSNLEAAVGLLETLKELHGDVDAALAAFDEELIPLQAAGDPDRAAEAYAKAVEADPDNQWTRACLGHALVEAERLPEAMSQYEALAAEGEDRLASEGHYMPACIHALLGDTGRALDELEAAIMLPTGGKSGWLLNHIEGASQPGRQANPGEFAWNWCRGSQSAMMDYDRGPALAVTALQFLIDEPRFIELVGNQE